MPAALEIRPTKKLHRYAVLKSDLAAPTRQILLTILCHVSPAGEVCAPTVARLAQETGFTKRTVLAHVKIARAARWLA